MAVCARVDLHHRRHVDLGSGPAPLAFLAHPQRVADREDALGDTQDDGVKDEPTKRNISSA